MKSDKRTNTRRKFLQAAVVLGALSTGRALFAADTEAPETRPAQRARARPTDPHPAAAGPPPSADHAGTANAPEYRVHPMAGETALSGPGASPPHPDVAYTLSTDSRDIFLTFDDGPHPHHTPDILRILHRHDAQATFFVIGRNAVAFPGLLRDIADEGHAVANHTWSHPQLPLLPPGAVRSELGRTSSLIEDVLGAAPNLARAPYGAWDDPSLSICNELGMSPVGWAIDSEDWTGPGAEIIADTVMHEIRPGAIVLSHDGGGERSQTVDALEWYLPRLLDEGYRPIRIEP
ncbi:polysaccharide deacetylase family protein [Streptomyces inhibens]|uniref:Polysaccharide deacetylase family protein n=1 Tax=Streptomyces inhibens TaxID=2293571 RepID=A0A371QBQ9_STRIH|nr:polysaccharide deacetylase family protein [Streptomyces inhibens]REK92107.1 polysaccharide deacetylase family protein [Streptomyces inhibens]